jgi:phosphohistidine phosphatase SixA
MKVLTWGACAAALAVSAGAQVLSHEALTKDLQQGGYIIVMRHASSPREAPDRQHANPDNTNMERQLDSRGRETAVAMGKAIRNLKIPVGSVLTSPTYRAVETIHYAELGEPRKISELGDNGQSMQGGTQAQAAWLQKKITEFTPGTNILLVTHLPNIRGAFPQLTPPPEDGESLIFGPDGKGGSTLVGRIKIEEWAQTR